MKRSLLLAAAMLLAANANAADVQSGAWTVYSYPSSDTGRAVCGVRVNGDMQRSLHVKYILGDAHLTMMLFKASWRFPSGGVNLPMTVWLDAQSYSTDNARGQHGDQVGALIVATIPNKVLDEFLSNFADASRMTVTFDSGNEPAWKINMAGSRYAAKLFKNCVSNLIDNNPVTQPYGSPQATQPYGKPQATQPFGKKPADKPAQPVIKKDNGSI